MCEKGHLRVDNDDSYINIVFCNTNQMTLPSTLHTSVPDFIEIVREKKQLILSAIHFLRKHGS